MHRKIFLDALRRYLAQYLTKDELHDVVAYYEEYFREAGAEREAEVIAELVSPAAVADKLLEARMDVPQVKKTPPVWLKPMLLAGGALLVSAGLWLVIQGAF